MAATCEIYPDFEIEIPSTRLPWEDDLTFKARQDEANQRKAQRENFYVVLRHLLSTRFGVSTAALDPDMTAFARRQGDPAVATPTEVIEFSAVAGMLMADNLLDPSMGRVGSLSTGDVTVPGSSTTYVAVAPYVDHVVAAVQRYNRSPELFAKVFAVLKTAGAGPGASAPTVYPVQLAEITARLVDQGIGHNDPQLTQHVNNLLSVVLGDSTQARASAIDIDLPDLEEGSSASVIGDNVKALAAIYYAGMLEEYKFFAVGQTIIEHFTTGLLPLTRGPGGQAIYQIMRRANDRMTETERRSLYARSFGLAGGSVDVQMPNREFSDLWVRFLSSVSMASRQSSFEATRVNREQVFKAGRDLAVNLSMHGYGLAHFGGVELQATIKDYLEMMSYPDVHAAYGVRDRWQLVERVSQLYLGGPVNGVRQRTMAQAGAKIIQWLGDRAAILSMPYPTDAFAKFGRGEPVTTTSSGGGTTTNFIVNGLDGSVVRLAFPDGLSEHVERWLAVTGTNDAAVEKYSEPVAVNQQPTIPSLTLAAMPNMDAVQKAARSLLPNNLLPQG